MLYSPRIKRVINLKAHSGNDFQFCGRADPTVSLQLRIVAVAGLTASEERVGIECGQRQALGEPTWQVRIRHERPTERDQVGIALRQDPLGASLVVLAGDNDRPREARTNGLAEFLS